MQVAQTILEQLGGNKFVAMTGAKNLVGGEGSLQMKLGSGATNNATHLTVTLDAVTDTYIVQFSKVRGVKVERMPAIYGVHADQLREIFTDQTGLRTSL